MKKMKILKKPYSGKDLKKITKGGSHCYVRGIVSLDISELFEGYEGFLSALSMKLIGSDILMDITHKIVGGKNNTIYVEVCGDCSLKLELLDL